MGPEIRLNSIGQIGVHVSDLKSAVDFYREKLGLTLVGEAPPSLAFFDCGGVRLMLSAMSEGGSDGSSVLYFDVADIRDAYEALRGRGVRFTGSPMSSTRRRGTSCGWPSSRIATATRWPCMRSAASCGCSARTGQIPT